MCPEALYSYITSIALLFAWKLWVSGTRIDRIIPYLIALLKLKEEVSTGSAKLLSSKWFYTSTNEKDMTVFLSIPFQEKSR